MSKSTQSNPPATPTKQPTNDGQPSETLAGPNTGDRPKPDAGRKPGSVDPDGREPHQGTPDRAPKTDRKDDKKPKN